MSFTGKPLLTTDVLITNDGFFPDLQLKEFLDDYRIPSEYGDNTIAHGVKNSVLEINHKLKPVKAAATQIYIAGGSLPDWTGEFGDWYKKAVFSYAKAFLLQQFNSMNRRKDAENAAKEAPETYQFWADESQKAVYFLMNEFAPAENVTANHGVYVGLI